MTFDPLRPKETGGPSGLVDATVGGAGSPTGGVLSPIKLKVKLNYCQPLTVRDLLRQGRLGLKRRLVLPWDFCRSFL